MLLAERAAPTPMLHRRLSALILLLAASTASLATECGQSPRGLPPTTIGTVQLRFVSSPAPEPPPSEEQRFANCLQQMGQVTNVAPSWRSFQTVNLTETMANVFEMTFNDVPVGVTNSMTVRDPNECRRNPAGEGRVTTGVSVNGTPIGTVDPVTGGLFFTLDDSGMVSSPVQIVQPSG